MDDARLLLKRKSGRQSGNRSRVTKQQQQRNNLKFTSTYRKMNCAVAFELAVGYFLKRGGERRRGRTLRRVINNDRFKAIPEPSYNKTKLINSDDGQ